MASEDSVLIKQITATHKPDGREINVRQILQIAEDIINSAITTLDITRVGETEAPAEKSNSEPLATMLGARSHIINRLSCEISNKCRDGEDGHSTAVSMLNLLSSYSWDAKVALTLAAFALNYGVFSLLAQIHTTDRLASRMAILKQLPALLEHAAPLKPRFDALNGLIRSVLDLTKSILQFSELPKKYISQDNLEHSEALASFPLATYWIFRSLIAAATYISYRSDMRFEKAVSFTEGSELSSFSHMIESMNKHLQKQLAICRRYAEENMQTERYDALLSLLEAGHTDNMEVLKSLICPKDNILPLFYGTRMIRVNLDVLRRKTVLLLISGLDISPDETSALGQIFKDSRVHEELQYDIVWIPVVDRSTPWTESNQKQFESLQSRMPWYSVQQPGLIDTAVIRFFKENLHFNRKAISVVLDQQGRIIRRNALHMMWIWGNLAYPFTSSREEDLWKAETWRLELLVDGIDPETPHWIEEGKHIILYGSDDIDWIRKFTNATRSAATAAKLPLEMVYVGSRNFNRDRLQRVIGVITDEKLGEAWRDTKIWFFWTRLESMLFSKIEVGGDDENDHILQEIKKLLSCDRMEQWVLFSKGSEVILNGDGDTALLALLKYDTWEDVEARGFGTAFKDCYQNRLDGLHHHCQLRFEDAVGKVLEHMKCPLCGRSMKKSLIFAFK